MKRYRNIIIILLLFTFFCNTINSQEKPRSLHPNVATLDGQLLPDGTAHIDRIHNKSNKPLDISIDGGGYVTIEPNGDYYPKDNCKLIRYSKSDGDDKLWEMEPPKKQVEKQTVDQIVEEDNNKSTNEIVIQKSEVITKHNQPQVLKINNLEELLSNFKDYISKIDFYSMDAIESEKRQIEYHINNLRKGKELDKLKYLREFSLEENVDSLKQSLKYYQDSKTSLITQFSRQYNKDEIRDGDNFDTEAEKIVNSLREQREENIKLLEDAIDQAKGGKDGINWQLIAIIVGVALLLIALVSWYVKTNKKNKHAQQRQAPHQVSAAEAASSIVVRRKTTSILRKQSLEDVMDNNSYLAINCNEFCNDSAVRRMYIKNTCIKDIYNMYAEDLRNPDNPKEDGCMVLGRWVYDKDNNDYYVSLEHVVLPGDDAIFAEYELNFGGKIKLKVTEKLRKLRRDTGLQYDLTCWVHSHPGLGVFFSNSDTNVQMQLKHPTHPNFLTAIVIDILTPQQEMGIFTFKKDSSINSKNDLTRMYSLEELYQWAVESDRNSFKPEDYYNTLVAAKSHTIGCYGIELSNGAIIDISKFAMEQTSGFVGMVHGYAYHEGAKTEHIAKIATTTEAVPDNELIGAFVITAHLSIPSIRKAIAPLAGKIRFVLVYTTTDGLLTSIPVVNNELCSDETYYGEQTLEDLKIWTRRKR